MTEHVVVRCGKCNRDVGFYQPDDYESSEERIVRPCPSCGQDVTVFTPKGRRVVKAPSEGTDGGMSESPAEPEEKPKPKAKKATKKATAKKKSSG